MTDQEIINDIYAGLQAQPGIAAEFLGYGNANRCLYLDEHGNKCAVGLYIPDGHSAQANKGDVCSLLKDFPDLLLKPVLKERPASWWEEVQSCHDEATYGNLEDKPAFLAGFAKKVTESFVIDATLEAP